MSRSEIDICARNRRNGQRANGAEDRESRRHGLGAHENHEPAPTVYVILRFKLPTGTVKSHVASATNKHGADNRAHVAAAAIQRGLL